MEYGALFDVARRRNIETVNFESSAQRRGCYVLSRNSPFGALDTGPYGRRCAPRIVCRDDSGVWWADARGGRDRFSEKGRGRHLLEAPELKLIAKEIGLDPNRPIVARSKPDMGYGSSGARYDISLGQGLDAPNGRIAERPEIQLAIRSHPLEDPQRRVPRAIRPRALAAIAAECCVD